jgi:hypothetical protein
VFNPLGRRRKGQRGEILPEENKELPDSYRPSGLCPRCSKQSSFEVVGSLPITIDYETHYIDHEGRRGHDPTDQVTSLICRHCNQGVVVIEERWVGDAPGRENRRGGGTITYRGIHWWPLPEAQLSSDIPTQIGEAFSEASTALMAQCPRAAVVMARRTLEAIAADKGEAKGPLAQRLDALSSKGVLHPNLSEWAIEVRLIGNTGAHFDPIQHVSMEDARQLFSFVRELLRYLYELPAELARRRSP